MKLKTKLMGIVLIVVLFIMTCSTVVVYLLLGRQYRAAAQDSFVNTADIIKDDLSRQMAKMARDSDDLVRSTEMSNQSRQVDGNTSAVSSLADELKELVERFKL
ncbi:MAG: hypothetical protein P8X55_06435 [Desulfosarcinaceae bacterium]